MKCAVTRRAPGSPGLRWEDRRHVRFRINAPAPIRVGDDSDSVLSRTREQMLRSPRVWPVSPFRCRHSSVASTPVGLTVGTIAAGVVLVVLGLLTRRAGNKPWSPSGQNPVPTLEMERKAARMSWPAAVVCGSILVVVGIVSLLPNQDAGDAADRGSWDTQPAGAVLSAMVVESGLAGTPQLLTEEIVCVDECPSGTAWMAVFERPDDLQAELTAAIRELPVAGLQPGVFGLEGRREGFIVSVRSMTPSGTPGITFRVVEIPAITED